MDRRGRIGAVLGPLLFLVLLLAPRPDGLSVEAWRVAALTVWMATWWITEPIPLPATGLLPLVALPFLGIGSVAAAAAPFADPVIFLFLGGFLLAIGIETWRLHERVAFRTASLVGTRPPAIVAGFMLATAFLSMWISNTAAVLLMVPMVHSLLALAKQTDPQGAHHDGFGKALLLGTAYGATIGGLATLIGTPPNAILAGYAATQGIPIGFGQWMLFALPVSIVGLVACWFWLTRIVFRLPREELPGGASLVRDELTRLGPMKRPEIRVGLVFVVTATLWLARPALEALVPTAAGRLTDPGIAVAAGIALFLLPSGTGRRLLVWEDARRVPWGILLLFGGGLSLASAVDRTGLAAWIGEGLAKLDFPSTLVLVAVVAALVLLMTEFTSNTATAATLMPLMAGLALAMDLPLLVLMLPVAMAASCAFMLPVATPPNAVVYGAGGITVPDMVRAGWGMNLLFLLLITAAVVWWAPVVFGT